MTAICKVIPIHSKNLTPIIDYIEDMKKSDIDYAKLHSESDYIKAVFDYTENPLKTQFGIDDGHEQFLISGVNCNPDNAILQFAQSKQKYLGSTGTEQRYRPFEMKDKRTNEIHMVMKEPVQAIHLIQSFSETDLDPRVIHQIGIELAERLDTNCQAVVSTHMNKQHTHNHIVINSFKMDGSGKIPCNRTKLLEIRQLSDTIQREYGIEIKFASPEQQLQVSKLNGRHNSYVENKKSKEGLSWKLQMMTDITAIRQIVETKEEFIELMNDYGYDIVKETKQSVTWINHTTGKKIRDTTLGQEFTMNFLFPEHTPTIPVKKFEKEQEKTSLGTISISKYDWDGRKRSELEILIRKVIAIIQKVQHTLERIEKTNSTHTPKYKLQLMDEALTIIRSYGIENKAELKQLIQQTVSTYNHYKSEIASMELEKDWYSSLSSFITMIEEAKSSLAGHLPGEAKSFLPNYISEEIRKNRAKQFPMSEQQKKELYYKCKIHPEWHLAYKYEQLTSLDAKKVLDFFNGRSSLPTDLLLTTTQYEARKKENYQKVCNHSSPKEDFQTIKKELDEQFYESIKERPLEHQLFFTRLRNQMDYLSSIGINPYHLDEYKEEISQFEVKYESALHKREEYRQKYKELLKLQQSITYAETPSFIYGTIWDDRKNEPTIVDVKVEQDMPSNSLKKHRIEKNTISPSKENIHSNIQNLLNTDIDI